MPWTHVSTVFTKFATLFVSLLLLSAAGGISSTAQVQADCPDGEFLINQSFCGSGCPDPEQVLGPRGICYCPETGQSGQESCAPEPCQSTEGLQDLSCRNPRTFRRKFLYSQNTRNFINKTPNNQLIYDGLNAEKTPVVFTYTSFYQLKHRGQCLTIDRQNQDLLELASCNTSTPNTRFHLLEDGTIESIDYPGFFISNSTAKFGTSPQLHQFLPENTFEVRNSPFLPEDCEAGQIKVENQCVCDPEQLESNCLNSDGEVCTQRREYRLMSECVPLRTLNRINNQFRRYYDQGFWIN